MEELADNNRERNVRRGNPGRSHRKVTAWIKGSRQFKSKVEAAKFYGVDVKTVYNQCEGKVKFSRSGVRFAWST